MKNFARIEEIYHAALEIALAERDEFLKSACGDDEELRHEVESLIFNYESAGDFIESPPEDIAADFFANRAHENLVGKEFSHYRILSQLGMGGMGEVYLAEDTKLVRKIAIKLLPPQFSQDFERRLRFEQEARAISALNHPNIITIHGIEQTEEWSFIATEFIEGQTLREKIAQEKLSWQQTVEIGIQIANALESAHSVELIHRDIKPANIMIRGDGIVKVLDFGLAKLVRSGGEREWGRKGETEPNPNISPQLPISDSQLTKADAVMGTINYMSPEQALGQQVDERTDIFSFGVVLYEMLSGERPFDGASNADIYEATIKKNPRDVKELNSEIPSALSKAVKRALEKNPEDRYQTVSELRAELEKINETASLSQSHSIVNSLKFIAPIVVLILISAVIYFAYFRNPFESEIKFSNYTQLTSQKGEEIFPNLSPDGKSILYSRRDGGNWDIYLKKIGEEKGINLTANSLSDDFQAAFSPDGKQIAFHSERDGGGIFLMDTAGGNVRKVSDFGFLPGWSPNGQEIAFTKTTFFSPVENFNWGGGMWILNVRTGEKREILQGDVFQPSWSPNGETITFWSVEEGGVRKIKTISPNGDRVSDVTTDNALNWNPVWSPDGKTLYFASDRGGSMNFWRIAIDQKNGKTQGNPEPFTTPSIYSGNLTFASDSKTFAFAQQIKSANIFQAVFDDKEEKIAPNPFEITPGRKINQNPSVSPNGEWIAFDAVKDKQEDIFVIKTDGTNLLQLTNDLYKDRAPRWSPDGSELIFYSDRSGKYESWVIKPDGSGLRQITSDAAKTGLLAFWSPDGKRILQNIGGREPQIFDADGVKNIQLLPEKDPKFSGMAFDWSPDGNKLAFLRLGKDTRDLGVDVYSFSTQKFQDVTSSGDAPVWLKDSRRLIYVDRNKFFLFDTATGRKKELMSFPPDSELQSISLSRDNRFIYFALVSRESNLWVASSN